MTFLFSTFAFLFSFLAMTAYVPARYVWMWEASVVATEYGHWLAAFGLLVAFIALASGRRLAAGLFLASSLTFAGPVIELYAYLPYWKAFLNDRLGPEVGRVEPIPLFKNLWNRSPDLEKIKAESFTYAQVEGVDLRMEFYRSQSQKTLNPWILVIPGGSWGESDPASFQKMNQYLATNGFSVVAVSYRLIPQFPWPAQQNDILKAIEYVKAHAADMGVDPENWVILGRSAGGQIAESVAYSRVIPGLKGCVAYYAPADIHFAYMNGTPQDVLPTETLLRNFTVGEKGLVTKEALQSASAYLKVSEKSPPTLLLHAPRDPLVWVFQSQRLAQALAAKGVPVTLVEVPWGTHGFDYNFNGPGGQLSTYATVRFLNKVLFAPEDPDED